MWLSPYDFFRFIFTSLLPCSLCSSRISFILPINIHQMSSWSALFYIPQLQQQAQSSCLMELTLPFCFSLYIPKHILCGCWGIFLDFVIVVVVLPGTPFFSMIWFFTSIRYLLKCHLIGKAWPPNIRNLHSFPLFLQYKLHQDKDLVCPDHFDVPSGWHGLVHGRWCPINILWNIEWIKW